MKHGLQEFNRRKKWLGQTSNGVYYDTSRGWFELLREPHHTDADIQEAKREIRNTRDAVGIGVTILCTNPYQHQ